MYPEITDLLKLSSARHEHLCPRQVLGVRMGLAGLAALGLASPVTRSTGLVLIETDGCFADGIEVATGATLGHRTLRVHDLGKMAATFAELRTGRAIRVSPAPAIRSRARLFAGQEPRHYFAQLEGYQRMPEAELLHIQEVELRPSLQELISRPGVRVECDYCGEEIINEREVRRDGAVLCQTCAQPGYYLIKSAPDEIGAVISHRSPEYEWRRN